MRMIAFLMFVGCMQLSATALSQQISLSVNNTSLKKVLGEISKQSGYLLLFSGDASNRLSDSDSKIAVTLKKASLKEAMDAALKDQPLTYKLVEKNIIIMEQPPSAHAAIDTTITVSGLVTDEKGQPMPGVIIRAARSKKNAVTANNGSYSINTDPEDKLSFTFIGYNTLEKAVGNTHTLNITMTPATKGLNEVIVTGYQQIDKTKFSGAAVKLKADDIKMDGATDISRMLEGRAAGVSVQNVSGTFGSAPKLRIRGATSLTGANKPLWVVDGIVLEDVIDVSNDQLSSGDPSTLLASSVAGLNMNDVEDIYILKDAAATSMYGARAMNGVVVITTKKGRAGKLQTNYVGTFSSQLRPSYNNFNIMNSAEQMSVFSEMYRKGLFNLSNIGNAPDKGVFGKMYDLLQQVDPATGKFALENTPEARQAFLEKYAHANTNWFNILFRNSFIQEHTISLSGGSDKFQSYFSAGFYNDNGWTIADQVKRFTFNSQNTYRFTNKLSGSLIATGSVRQQQAPGTVNRTQDAYYGKMSRDFDINPYNYAMSTNRTITAYDDKGNLEYFTRNFAPFNIINELQNNKIKLGVIDVKLQGNLSWKITDHLQYDFIGALRYAQTTQEDIVTEHSNKAQAYRANYNATIANANRFLYSDPDFPNALPQVVLPAGGFYNRTQNALTNYNFRNSVNYIQSFGRHDINILAGQEVKYANRQTAYNYGYGYQYDYGGTPLIDYRIIKQYIEANLPYYGMSNNYDRYVAFFGKADYTFDKKYNFGAALRYDGSNQLGESSTARWLPTWSVSGAWNIDQEAFLKNVDKVTYLKLRGSYGLNATMGAATNSSIVLKTANTIRARTSDIESGIYIQDLENSDLTWEKQYIGNIGIDAGFFDNRLTLITDVYKKNGFDLIADIKTSGIGGQTYKQANYADMTSHGVEVTIGGEPVRRKDWGWRVNLTTGYNKNKITNAKNTPIIFNQVVAEGGNKEGYPVSSLFSLNYKGLEPQTGIPLFVDEKGQVNRSVNLQDVETKYLVYEGPVDPTLTGGLSNTFRYKSLSLNVLFTYQAGNKIRLTPVFKPTYSDLDALPREFTDRWTLPGDENKTNIPSLIDALTNYRMGGAYPYNNYNYSSARVADGGFVRLKYIALTYQLSPSLLKRTGLNNLSLTASGSNLWLLYADKKLKGQDPEFFNAGGVAQPLQRQVVISLKVGL
ncbi:SusC/RagA family TonB-linked outer membrane protein [Chitinophaga vietnamensis]|uniref:SusC/RagA family TonB-linked outer membrane protein n=1 Tax=Chitinophaga vietnamensis TaxID=2593957 RepID=UPI001F0000FA|nr:SusC/RagA family TonB-linked outer membrane protein [Chitinophaga vietnamensis]